MASNRGEFERQIVDRLGRIEAALDDPLAKLQASVATAAGLVRGSWLIFLLIGLYLAILGAQTDHELLFKAGNLDVPLLNIGLPVFLFYVGAPGLFLILHAHLLLQVYFLSRKAFALDARIRKDLGPDETAQAPARRVVYPSLLVEMLIGHRDSAVFRWLLWTVNVVTLCILPPLLLLWLQLRFLPYQSEWVTLWHRAALLIDLVLIWFLWPMITHRVGWWTWFRSTWTGSLRSVSGWVRPIVLLLGPVLGTVGALAFAMVIAIIPLGWIEEGIVEGPTTPLTRWLFDRDGAWFARRLSLPERRDLVERAPAAELIDEFHQEDDPRIAAFGKYAEGLDLRERNFRGADLNSATITRALLVDADLRGADLSGAQLVGATFCRKRHDEQSDRERPCADLEGAGLSSSVLDGAFMREIPLQGADLFDASLQGAELTRASLQGANLRSASLQGANLFDASLQGANLFVASLQGAELTRASLQGADLNFASLQGANLFDASLQGAELTRASLQGADLLGASLEGADLGGASLQGADLSGASLQGADLGDAELVGIEVFAFDRDRWRLADLRFAALWPDELGDEERDRFAPPTADEIEAWRSAALEGIADEEARQRKSARFDALLRALDQPPLPGPLRIRPRAFENRGTWEQGYVLLPAWFPADPGTAPPAFIRGSFEPLPLVDEEALGNSLADLACKDDALPETAAGIARRIAPFGNLFPRLSASIVAEEMTGDDCPAAAGLDDDVKSRLQALAEREPELRAYAAALDAYYATCVQRVPHTPLPVCSSPRPPDPPVSWRW